MRRSSGRVLRGLGLLALTLALLLAGPLFMLAGPQVDLGGHWASADRSSAGLAPMPERTPKAVVQVYAARAFNWWLPGIGRVGFPQPVMGTAGLETKGNR